MIRDRQDRAEPAGDRRRDATGVPAESDHTRQDLRAGGEPTRTDLPRGYTADHTRQDLPHRPRREPAGPPDRSDDEDEPPRRSRWRWVRRVIYLVIALVVGLPLFAGFRVWWVARQDQRPRSDAIVVLGAAQYNGRPGPVLEWRLRHALALYRQGVARSIVTVGGNRPGDNYTEAGTGVHWLNEHGVPMSRLVGVRSGSDTLESMVAVGKAFKARHWTSAVIVTDPPHALRSATMARDNGIEKAATSPTRSGPTVMSRDTQFHYIVRETGGYLYYVLVLRYRDST